MGSEAELVSKTRITTTQEEETGTKVSRWVTRYLWIPESAPPSVSTSSAEASRLSKVRAELNKLLVDVMEGWEKPGSRQVVARILDVFFERFGKQPGGVRVYIAATTAKDLLTPGTPDAQALANHIGFRGVPGADDFAYLYLGDETASLNLLTIKKSGITGKAVRAADERAEEEFRRRQRKGYEGLTRRAIHFPVSPLTFTATALTVGIGRQQSR